MDKILTKTKLLTEKILVRINGKLDVLLDFHTIKTNKLCIKHQSEYKYLKYALRSTYSIQIWVAAIS